MSDTNNNWKPGPLPPNTWNWGAVVLFGEGGKPMSGFYFADFHGDHATISPKFTRKVQAHEVAFYNNSITLPEGGRIG